MKKTTRYLLMVPCIVMLIVFLILPLLSIIMPTVFKEHFSLDAYIQYFQDEYYRQIFFRTLRIAGLSAIICMILGIPTAYFISRCKKKWRGIWIAISIFPILTNSVVRSFAWIQILGKEGIINNLLMQLNLIDEPLTLLYTEFSILIGTIYLFLPIMIITLVGVMENIDTDLMEASQSLGANRFRSFLKVILPLSIPGILVGSVLVFTGALSAYTTPQLLGGNKNLVMATFIYQKAMSEGDWTGAGVVAVIMIVTTLIVMKGLQYITSKIDKRGETHA